MKKITASLLSLLLLLCMSVSVQAPQQQSTQQFEQSASWLQKHVKFTAAAAQGKLLLAQADPRHRCGQDGRSDKAAGLGDSNMEFMDRFNPVNRALDTKPENILELANGRLGQILRTWIWEDGAGVWGGANQGVAGYKISDVLAQLSSFIPQAQASGVCLVFVNVGGNGDINLDAVTREVQMASVITQLRDAGFVVLVSEIPPRRRIPGDLATWGDQTDPRWQWRIDFNTWLRTTYANDLNVYVLRINPSLYENPPSVIPEQAAQYVLKDTAHFAPNGAWLWSVYDLDTHLTTIFQNQTSWLTSAGTNYWPNATLTGTGGTAGTGVTGTVATNMTLERINGDATCTASKNGSDQQVIMCSPGSAQGTSTFYFRHSSPSYLSGVLTLPPTAYIDEVWKYTADNWNGWADVSDWAYDGLGTINYRGLHETDFTAGGIQHAYTLTNATPPMCRCTLDAYRVRFLLVVYGGNDPQTGVPIAGTGTITLERVWVVQTTNSATEFAINRPN